MSTSSDDFLVIQADDDKALNDQILEATNRERLLSAIDRVARPYYEAFQLRAAALAASTFQDDSRSSRVSLLRRRWGRVTERNATWTYRDARRKTGEDYYVFDLRFTKQQGAIVCKHLAMAMNFRDKTIVQADRAGLGNHFQHLVELEFFEGGISTATMFAGSSGLPIISTILSISHSFISLSLHPEPAITRGYWKAKKIKGDYLRSQYAGIQDEKSQIWRYDPITDKFLDAKSSHSKIATRDYVKYIQGILDLIPVRRFDE